ncbi:type II toxin-antitoxin system VapC family toxin [Mycobacterium heidelbergense]|uniref:Ribonuclease VapC n=1 Tax=Mycobacterium heidelbergense TaxID=53376 RepID=A0A1X0DIC2_MYCHE|nr:type II toxin-antitoxin system VapC family toxin [Mycobacterium heidelbergense]MCV7050542.1 type II toxin-antitoxin system VapC family toxin [Mycobacterium heidelbergense]ORA71942.1 VapC toxin family PIN domain ribonuclease [Mycobacterium heidelbergense]BBZ49330.1 ribonuclease VapC [Mycobacterium heidelbergense]
MAAIYLDSSAIVKLAVREPESDALRRYLRTHRPRVSSALARTEVMRALLRQGESARKAGRRALAGLDLLRLDNRVLDLAGGLLPFDLRSLDAIHLATAQRLGADLGRLCTYDDRMRDAAEALGMTVIALS